MNPVSHRLAYMINYVNHDRQTIVRHMSNLHWYRIRNNAIGICYTISGLTLLSTLPSVQYLNPDSRREDWLSLQRHVCPCPCIRNYRVILAHSSLSLGNQAPELASGLCQSSHEQEL